MAIPGYQDFMLPILKLASDGKEHSITETLETLAEQAGISEHEREIMLPSGTQTRLYNRVTWAVTYLTKSVLLKKVARGKFKLTDRGSDVLKNTPPYIDNAFLGQFSEFQLFKTKKNPKPSDGEQPGGNDAAEDIDATPDERLDAAYKELRGTLADDLLEKVRNGTDKFFEHLVVDLLVAMGYGGSQEESGRVVGRSGDGGIDGVIQEDRLGLDMVYIQAKKWQNNVGPDEIRKFVGSLGEQKAHKGVFITSGAYTSGARQAADKANAKVVLIDGEQLAQLMIDHGVGVADHKAYVIKKLDSDYFDGI